MGNKSIKNKDLSSTVRAARAGAAAAVLLVMTACVAPNSYQDLTIDGSDGVTTQQSVQRVVRSLPESKQAEFLLALVKIQVHAGQLDPAALLKSDTAMQHVNYQFIGRQVNGLTAAQVVAKATSIQ